MLTRLTLDLAAGRRPPRGLLASVGVFRPKGAAASDVPGSGARTRAAADTRPLALKNTSSKATAAVLNDPLRRDLAEWMPPQQQGFLRGRGPVRHVLWLDTVARGATAMAADTEWDIPLPDEDADGDAEHHSDEDDGGHDAPRRRDRPDDASDDDERVWERERV